MGKAFVQTPQPIGIHSEHTPKGLFLFGTPFIGVGIWMTLIGLKVIKVDPSTVHAPYWLLTLVGVLFGSAGLIIWNTGLQQLLQVKRIAKQVRLDPNNKAVADYDWDPRGYSPPRWKPTFGAWIAFAIFALFGAISYWISFIEKGTPWFVKGMSILLGLIIIWVAMRALRATLHAFKYGKSQLVFSTFPIGRHEEVPIEINLPIDLRRATGATLILRHIEEYYQDKQVGNKHRRLLITNALHEETRALTQIDLAQWPRSIRATFRLPENAPSTQLFCDHPHYWQLELQIEMPGLDFKQHYLLPIY